MPVKPAEAFEEMKRYVRFGQDDERALRALREHARPHFEEMASAFYERAREHAGAHAVFESDLQINRLHDSMVAWLNRVFTGPYDADYADKSARIGRVHVKVGLPQRFMFTAMTLFRLRLHDIAETTMAADAAAARAAISRILDLELALMNDAYHQASVERTERVEGKAREQMLSMLQRTDRLYVRAVDIAGAMLIGLDGQGRVQLFNREAQRVTGYPVDQVHGASFFDLLLHESSSGFQQAWTRAQGAHEPVAIPTECTLRTRTGRLRDIECHLSSAPKPEEPESDVIVILAGRDVTDERALASRVRRSEKLAAVGTLAAGLAHEIRNPLNGAQLHLTYLERGLTKAKEEDLREAIGVVSSEVSRLSALVNDFLEFARPTSLVRRPTNLKDVCMRAAAIVTSDDNVVVESDLPTSELIAEVDEYRIEQVLINLLRNAVEAAKDGGKRVSLRLRREPRDAIIVVHDDGPGLPSTAPIFDAFYSTKTDGTGLGLSIVHRIVDDHGGSIEFKSAPGDTSFLVRLPLTDPENPGAST